MNSNQFKQIINDSLIPFGFRRQQDVFWIRKAEEISMRVWLRESNAFYTLHTYYVINKISKEHPWDCECDTNFRWSRRQFLDIFDLECTDIPDDVRTESLSSLISESFSIHHFIETEEELRKMLIKERVPVFRTVRNYLGL